MVSEMIRLIIDFRREEGEERGMGGREGRQRK